MKAKGTILNQQTVSREIRYTETLEIYELNQVYLVVRQKSHWFFLKKDLNPFLKEGDSNKIFAFIDSQMNRRYSLFSKELLNFISTNGKIGTEEFYKLLTPETVEVEYLKPEDFKELESRIMYFDSSSHLFYSFDSEYPVTRAYHQSYISGVTNERFDLDKAQTILQDLEKNGWVWNIKKVKIPYYNASRYHNEALEFEWKLPQREYNHRVDYFRNKLKIKYWSCDLGRIVPYGLEDSLKNDVFGLKEALHSPKVLAEMDKECSDDED